MNVAIDVEEGGSRKTEGFGARWETSSFSNNYIFKNVNDYFKLLLCAFTHH